MGEGEGAELQRQAKVVYEAVKSKIPILDFRYLKRKVERMPIAKSTI